MPAKKAATKPTAKKGAKAAPKYKAKASAGKTGAAKASVLNEEAASSSAPLSAAASAWGEEFEGLEVDTSQRRLSRRDTDDAVDRSLKARLLPTFSLAALEGAVNAQGRRVRDVVADQLRKNRPKKKKLTTQFWTQLIADFKLVPNIATEGLPDPAEGEEPSDEFLENLSYVHSENPAARKTMPMEKFLQHCPELSYVELYGTLRASMEGPRVVRAASLRLLVAVLKYIARILVKPSGQLLQEPPKK